MSISASVIEHSSYQGIELITIQTRAPKFLDAEIEKHRMLSSNSSSDRAIPFEKNKSAVPFIPTDVRLNEPGMQGHTALDEKQAGDFYADMYRLYEYICIALKPWDHVHKQHLNRYILPFAWQHKVITGNREQFEYFLKLRESPSADPAIQDLASKIREAITVSEPTELSIGQWHLPYVTQDERQTLTERNAVVVSVARCARVSYSNHDSTESNFAKDELLYDMLRTNKHMTPFEHQATPMVHTKSYSPSMGFGPGSTHIDTHFRVWSANFRGFNQHRQMLEDWNP